MKKIIFDCDNTFGMPDRDVDDGLTLMYLSGIETIELLGVTLSHGNGTLAETVSATKTFQDKLGLDFPVYPGSRTDEKNEAAVFLANETTKAPQEITILATGALTNLAAAAKLDPDFFTNVKEIVVMGGTIAPLVVNQHPVTELNFTCDPAAVKEVLLSEADLTIMNGHMTAGAFFSEKEKNDLLEQLQAKLPENAYGWLAETLAAWIKWNEAVFKFSGFCNWDMTTAIYLEHPELFSKETYYLTEDQPELTMGRMNLTEKSDHLIKMPKQLLDLTAFNQEMIRGIVNAFKERRQQ